MKKEQLQKIFNNGGASLDDHNNIMDLNSGYSVSILGAEKVFSLDDHAGIIKEIQKKQKEVKTKKGYYVGVWINDNKCYVDISKTISNYKEAVKFGVNNKQLAIFNNKTKKEVKLIKNYYILYNYNESKNDLKYLIEFDNFTEAKEYLQKNYNLKALKDRVTTSLDNLRLLNNLVIFKDFEYLKDIEV